MKRLAWITPLLLVAALARAGDPPARSGTWQCTSYGFKIDSPSFAKIEQEASLVDFVAPPGQSPSHVTVGVEIRNKYTFERTVELYRARLDKLGFHVRDEKKLKVSGRDACLFKGDGPYKGTETTVLQLVVFDAPRIFAATGTCKTEDFARDEKALRASVESFTLDAK